MAVTFHEIIIKGNAEEARVYLEGFFSGRGMKGSYLFTGDHHFDLAHLKEMIKYRGDTLHVIGDSSVKAALAAAIKRAPARLGLEILETRAIERGYFHFRFETANREVATTIKKLLSRLPAGVSLTDYTPEEIVDPSARGAEVYSPLHDYVFKGSGVIEGAPLVVNKMHLKMKEHEFIECDRIALHQKS